MPIMFCWIRAAAEREKPLTGAWLKALQRPFLLAGGLGTDNLAEAIERLSPWAVDLSSSLEIGGLKDRDKIIEAVNIVRSFEQLK